MITVRLRTGLVTDNPVRHESADGFHVEDGFLVVTKEGVRVAAYRAGLVVSVAKEDCCCKR